MKMTRHFLYAAMVMGLAGATASAQTWAESGDAPDGPIPFQDTVGVGPLLSITGSIDRPNGDHVDTYCINITDPANFMASTSAFFGGSTDFDSRLWLWNANGGLVLANDDTPAGAGGGLASVLSDPSTYAALTGGGVVASTATFSITPGRYLLSISSFANDPEDVSNNDLALLGSDFDALHGPSTSAGAFDHWENTSDSDAGIYTIALRGATFCNVPTTGVAGLMGMGLGFLGVRRRR